MARHNRVHPRTCYKTKARLPLWVDLRGSDPGFLLATPQSTLQTTEKKGKKMMRVCMKKL